MNTSKPEASIARESAGLSLEKAAKTVGLSASYLARLERYGASWRWAQRLARLYGCRVDVFLVPVKVPVSSPIPQSFGRGGSRPKDKPSKRSSSDAPR